MTTAAGWHADPSGRHQLRYWDGSQWTAHVADGGVTGEDQPDPGMSIPVPVPPPAKTGGGWLDKISAAAQTATDQSSKWIDENLTSSSQSPAPGPSPANPAPAAASSPPPSASPPPGGLSAAASPQPGASPPPVASPSGAGTVGADQGDVADQLRKLAQLRDEGILTEAEFSAQKAKLLG